MSSVSALPSTNPFGLALGFALGLALGEDFLEESVHNPLLEFGRMLEQHPVEIVPADLGMLQENIPQNERNFHVRPPGEQPR